MWSILLYASGDVKVVRIFTFFSVYLNISIQSKEMIHLNNLVIENQSCILT